MFRTLERPFQTLKFTGTVKGMTALWTRHHPLIQRLEATWGRAEEIEDTPFMKLHMLSPQPTLWTLVRRTSLSFPNPNNLYKAWL